MRARFQFDLFLSSRAKHSAEITLSLLAYLWSFQFFLRFAQRAWRDLARIKNFSTISTISSRGVSSNIKSFHERSKHSKLNNISRTDRLPRSCRKWEMLNFFEIKKKKKNKQKEKSLFASTTATDRTCRPVACPACPSVRSRYACALTRRDVDGNGIGNSERRIYTSINVITRRRAARHDESGRV